MVLPTIRTSRLMLRTITPDDVDALFRIFGDPELTRYWGHPTLAGRAAAESLVEDIRTGADSGKLLQWGITLGGTADLIGTCTLASLDRQNRRADIGAALAPEHHGRGYAEEAVRAVIDHGFGELGLHRITADVDPRNATALRLVERLGFRREGLLREHYRQNDEWQDGLLFGLLKREWGDDE
ncbi:MAG TPA: GNAT family protein [Gemmatimonadota bacterium]|nr:GNAT family protein [Gemmatimonadota bacterium]